MSDDTQNNLASLVILEFAEKKMKAFLTVKESVNELIPPISSQSLIDRIEKEGVNFGLNTALLDEILLR